MTGIMLSPVPLKSFAVPSGNVYQADNNGIIVPVQTVADMLSLAAMGCATVTPNPTDLLGSLIGANFNTTADQVIALQNSVRYRITRIALLNTSVNGMNTAVGGFYTAAAKGGSAIVANTQVYTGLTNAATAMQPTIALPNLVLPAATPLYFALTTPQGAAATADIYVYGDVYP